MLLKPISLVCVWVCTLLIAVGCSNLTPTSTPAPTILSVVAIRASNTPTPPNVVKFGTLSNSGGSVTMDAQLLDFQINQPLVIEITMNTHSVELADEMTKVSILRDDSGNEYKPTAWEGAGPGGHHRERKLKFAAMTTQPKYIELVIKDLAKVAERSFRWELR